MDTIKHHLALFPPRLRKILEAFPYWDNVCEIRLRCNAPLSLTSHQGNIMLNEQGEPCPISRGVICSEDELSSLVGAFCGGSVYRYFDRLKDSFAVDAHGWRMGICSLKSEDSIFIPSQLLGINLRIPRQIPFAAKPIIEKMEKEGLFSLLIFSPPGEGKTTLLRSLAVLLSTGYGCLKPIRVCAVDERGELFPQKMSIKTGLLDILPDYKKGEGISLATRLFSPQIICCDEIGSALEADAVLSACSGGCYVVATAHAESLQEAKITPYLARLMESGKFRYGLFLKKEAGQHYFCRLQWEKF